MKIRILLLLVMIGLLSGCGMTVMDTMNCTYQSDVNNLTTRINYNIDYQNDEVKKVRITYDYTLNTDLNDTAEAPGIDGVGTGTDGTTSDTQLDQDGIIDGVVGSAIDTIVGTVTDTILDLSGIRQRHNNVLDTYGDINGFSVQNTNDLTDNNYRVSYVIDFDQISDDDLNALNLSRDINILRDNYGLQGFTCNQ